LAISVPPYIPRRARAVGAGPISLPNLSGPNRVPLSDRRSEPPGAGPRAHDRDRTGDLLLTKEVLYRLSYVGDSFPWHPTDTLRLPERETGIEPATFSLEG
jgi:hypothetical protein